MGRSKPIVSKRSTQKQPTRRLSAYKNKFESYKAARKIRVVKKDQVTLKNIKKNRKSPRKRSQFLSLSQKRTQFAHVFSIYSGLFLDYAKEVLQKTKRASINLSKTTETVVFDAHRHARKNAGSAAALLSTITQKIRAGRSAAHAAILSTIRKLTQRIKKRPTKRLTPRMTLPRIPRFAYALLSSLVLTTGIVSGSYKVYEFVFKDLPSVRELTERPQNVTTEIQDRNGTILYRIYEDENRTPIKLSELPPHVIQATISIEDRDFYHHNGFSVKGIARALMVNTQGTQVQGGSTITQQLIKIRLLTPERTVKRKARELVLSVLVEGTYSKNEILEMYLNEVAYGGSTHGIEAAARRYFGKSARELTLSEAALLAGLPAAPSAYTPFGPNPELAYQRQSEVLRRMVEDGYILPEQAEAAKNTPLAFKPDTENISAPHFVMYVREVLADRYGEDVVNKGGLIVRTSLDLPLQEKSQAIVTKEIEKLKRLRVTNGASLVTNPQTGEILAMVGSYNYYDVENDGQVNVTLRPRQPGSSIKPLTYALAMERGDKPSTVITDAPITYHIPGSPPYSPKNYDGRFHGNVTLRTALGSSYNIPAVKKAAEVGVPTIIQRGSEMGITTWQDPTRYGLAITLGGGEVRMLDLAQLYSTFATYGYSVEPAPILEVTNYKGEVLYRNECALDAKDCLKRQVLDPQVAFQITDILSDNRARTPAFGPSSLLVIPKHQVAVKTGTTNNLRDNWTIGYTSDRLVATWVGNNDGRPMSSVVSGVTGASQTWNETMRLVLSDTVAHRFAMPDGYVRIAVCATTGTLPCNGCPSVQEEVFVRGTEPTQACSAKQFQAVRRVIKPRLARPTPTRTPAPQQNTPPTDQVL